MNYLYICELTEKGNGSYKEGFRNHERLRVSSNKEEALAFLFDPILGNHIREISMELLKINSNDPIAVMGIPDNLKLRSCMTLFYEVSKEKVFYDVLVKFYCGEEDRKTLNILKRQEG